MFLNISLNVNTDASCFWYFFCKYTIVRIVIFQKTWWNDKNDKLNRDLESAVLLHLVCQYHISLQQKSIPNKPNDNLRQVWLIQTNVYMHLHNLILNTVKAKPTNDCKILAAILSLSFLVAF